ncbi:MAG: hypothetical protein H7329_20715 [Opitutaceae bacterium]|nr:hypothetical protein [Cytophagales bacterium]
MKKQILYLALLTIAGSSAAQIQKGAWSIGIITSINKVKPSVETYRAQTIEYNLSNNVSYYLSSKFSIGLDLGISANRTRHSARTEKTIIHTEDKGYTYMSEFRILRNVGNAFMISPSCRYYIPAGKKAAFVIGVHPGLSFGYFINEEATNNSVAYDSNSEKGYSLLKVNNSIGSSFSYNIGLRPAFIYFPSPKWGLEFSLSNIAAYSSTMFKTRTDNDYVSSSHYRKERLDIIGLNSLGVGTSIFYFIR